MLPVLGYRITAIPSGLADTRCFIESLEGITVVRILHQRMDVDRYL
jgi:hypothetical protein